VVVEPAVGVLGTANDDLQAAGKEVYLEAHHKALMLSPSRHQAKDCTVAFR
jgi:hypothetical protein